MSERFYSSERQQDRLGQTRVVNNVVADCIRSILGSRANAFRWKRPLMDMGLESIELLQLQTLLSERLDVELEPSFFFRHPTPQSIASYFHGNSSSVDDADIAPLARETIGIAPPPSPQSNMKSIKFCYK